MGRLEGKVALVTGAGSGIAQAIAEVFAREGAIVAGMGRTKSKVDAVIEAIEKSGGKGLSIGGDVSDEADCEAAVQATIDAFGRIDILVNGAGVNSPTPFLDIPEEEYDHIFAINTKAVVMACQVFGAYFLEHGIRASIINVGSMSAVLPLSRVFTYSMSKAAVHNISKNLAREWGTKDIRVNTIVPGFFPAEQNRKVLTDERVDQIMGHTPMNRFGEARELSGATLLLASEAGSFMTGTEVLVDGGYAAMTI